MVASLLAYIAPASPRIYEDEGGENMNPAPARENMLIGHQLAGIGVNHLPQVSRLREEDRTMESILLIIIKSPII